MAFFVYNGRHSSVEIQCGGTVFRSTPTGFRALSNLAHRAERRAMEGHPSDDAPRVRFNKLTTAIEVADNNEITLAAFRVFRDIKGVGFTKLPTAPTP